MDQNGLNRSPLYHVRYLFLINQNRNAKKALGVKKMKLLCLPYSGSSANIYLKWRSLFDEPIEVIPVEYPGRGKRFAEDIADNMAQLVDSLYSSIKNEVGMSDYAVFGHSLGGLAAYELVRKLIDEGHQAPMHLFVSGCNAPHIKDRDELLYKKSDEEFFEHILSLGGMDQEVLSNQELLDIFLPIIKADYKIYETYVTKPELAIPLTVDITAFTGDFDHMVTYENIKEWERYTQGIVTVDIFNGGHFFIHNHTEKLISTINQTLVEKKMKQNREKLGKIAAYSI